MALSTVTTTLKGLAAITLASVLTLGASSPAFADDSPIPDDATEYGSVTVKYGQALEGGGDCWECHDLSDHLPPASGARLLSSTVLPEAQAFALPGSPVLTQPRSPAGPGATVRTRKLSTRTFITLLDAMDPQPELTMGSSPHEVPKLPQGSGLTLRSDAPLTQTKPSTGSAESH